MCDLKWPMTHPSSNSLNYFFKISSRILALLYADLSWLENYDFSVNFYVSMTTNTEYMESLFTQKKKKN